MWRRSPKDVLFLTETLMSRYLRTGSYKEVARPPGPEQITILHFCMKALLRVVTAPGGGRLAQTRGIVIKI
jgi:hypothetical protein